MSLITNLTRMWLTRSVKPFIFKNEYDEVLPFADCEGLGLYVHIPFCRSICSFCPYCKVLFSQEACQRYVDSLLKEIRMTGSRLTEKKKVTSLYFGGGTPVLAAPCLNEIIDTIKRYFIITEGIGIQSFAKKYQAVLGRKPVRAAALAEVLSQVPFETVSMDFIFALPSQTFEDLKADIDAAFQNGANHIAIYPFIDFSFTSSKVPVMGKKEKRRLLDQITAYCMKKGYSRTSIWTFSSQPEARYSSMTRDNFLGFGCSATTLLKDQFKINTFSVEESCARKPSLRKSDCKKRAFTSCFACVRKPVATASFKR